MIDAMNAYKQVNRTS